MTIRGVLSRIRGDIESKGLRNLVPALSNVPTFNVSHNTYTFFTQHQLVPSRMNAAFQD